MTIHMTRQVVMLDGTSANSNVTISNAFLVADANNIVMSYTTNAAAVSVLSVQGSADNGLATGASTPTFSTFTSITGATTPSLLMLPGVAGAGIPRWIRVVRSAADSQASCVMSYRVI